MHVPVGKPVQVSITSADVIHSFWVPALAGKRDATPGHVTRIAFRGDSVGEYSGQCAEFLRRVAREHGASGARRFGCRLRDMGENEAGRAGSAGPGERGRGR